MPKKYLVYTCVTNNYDKINSISVKQDPNIDFICFTDKVKAPLIAAPGIGWQFYPIPNELNGLDPRRKARLVKILVNKWAPGYDGYLWIDSPIVIIGNLGPFFASHPFDDNHGIYVSKHYMRDCTYQEFAQVVRLGKDRSVILYDQLARYKKMKYPSHNGMAETSILYRNFKDLKVQVHADQWAHEIINYSYRDQLSFNWAGWYTKTPITYLNEHIYIKDTENETSDYFFLPWPKHNNDHVNQQVRECLAKRKKLNKRTEIIEVKEEEKKEENKVKKIHLMHWFFKDRKTLEFNDIEKFHIKILKKCRIDKKFDEIYFNFSMENFNSKEQKDFIANSFHQMFDRDGLKFEITFEKNDPNLGEFNTNFKLFDLVYDNPENTILFYNHSKGASKQKEKDILFEKYWSYLMYKGCLLDGYNEAMEKIKSNASYGSMLRKNEKSFIDEIHKYSEFIRSEGDSYYAGTFYWLNLGFLKKKYCDYDKNEFKKKLNNLLENFSKIRKPNNAVDRNYYKRKWQSEVLIPILFYPNSEFEKLRAPFEVTVQKRYNDGIYADEFKEAIKNPKILVYTYAENLKDKEFKFSKADGVDYLLLTDKSNAKTNYSIEPINFNVGDTIFKRNKFYKWHPELLNTKDYDYIIYHDIRMNILNVFDLIDEMENSKYGINLSKHRLSDSIEKELQEIDKLFKHKKRDNVPKDYVETVRKKVGEKNLKIKTTMPEATVIVYEMKKLNYDLKNEIYDEFKNFGSIRDQPSIANVCLNKGVDIASICTLNGVIPIGSSKNSKNANKNLKEVGYYFVNNSKKEKNDVMNANNDEIILVMTTYPERMQFAIRSLSLWKEYTPSLKMALFLSKEEYPNGINSIPKNDYDKLLKLNVELIFRNGNEKAFKSYFAGLTFKNKWLLQTDDDYYPSKQSFRQFMDLHNKHKKSFICWSRLKNNIVGNGVLYNPSMLDKRYLDDMPLIVKFDLCDIWLSYWAKKSKINVVSGVGIEKNIFEELSGKPGLTNMKDEDNKQRKNILEKYMFLNYGKV